MNWDNNIPKLAGRYGERPLRSARRGRSVAGLMVLLAGFAVAPGLYAGQQKTAPPPPSHSGPPPQHNSAPPPRSAPAPQPHNVPQQYNHPPQQHPAPQPYNAPTRQPYAPPPQHSAPQPYNVPQQNYNAPRYPSVTTAPGARTQHLADWLQTHQHLAPADQQKALQQEPGFKSLPPAQQQRLITRLQDLNNKTPEQRQRTLNRVEMWERMSPAQKQQVTNSTAQLRALPPDRQVPLRRAFRDLRDLPPEQRQQMLNSSEFQGQFSAQERGILGNLLTVEPYQANRPANANPSQPPQSNVPIPAYR
jgi:hypothetical protein